MNNEELDPKRQPYETADYTDDSELPDPENLKIVKDFLPAPEDLVFKNADTKISINLDTESLEFFKQEAERLHTPYQRMIRNLLSEYVKVIDSMFGFMNDVGANFGGVVTTKNFSLGAQNWAKFARIDFRTVTFTSPEDVVDKFAPSLDFSDPRNSMYIFLMSIF